MKADTDTEAGVCATIQSFFDDIRHKRLEETLNHFTGDPDCRLFGSDAGEEAFGPAELRQLFLTLYDKPFNVSFNFRLPRVSAAANVAWFSANADLQISNEQRFIPYTMACVLEKRDGQWLLQLFHGSEPR